MYLVAGLGITGQSVLRYLDSCGEKAFAFDTRENFDFQELAALYPNIEFACGQIPDRWLGQFSQLVLSPGIAKAEAWVHELVENYNVDVIGDIELFARAVGVPVISITGSNGKSSVTTLVGELLKNSGFQVGVGGNIGTPALDLLADDNEYEVYVLELSSFQLETTHSLHSISATVLNISEDHLDRYDSMAQYIEAKFNIFSDCEMRVMPKELEDGLQHIEETRLFSLEPPQSANEYGVIKEEDELWIVRGAQKLLNIQSMKLSGLHHQLNAMACLALCEFFDVNEDAIERTFANFSGLPYRTEFVRTLNDVAWINDSKGTNVGATITALESFGQAAKLHDGKVILLLGGVGKDADFSPLAPVIKAFCRETIVFGRDKTLISDAIGEASPVIVCEDLQRSVEQAKKSAQANDVVLFSPACASFDQFANYVQRGQIFNELVNQLAG